MRGNPPVTGGLPEVDSHHKGPVGRNFDVSFDVSLKKPLEKQSKCWWFESLWRSYDIIVMQCFVSAIPLNKTHYNGVIVGAIASQITSLTIVYSTVYSSADQRKHQSSASLAFVRGIHRGPVNSSHKWPVTRKMLPFDDDIMTYWHCSELLLTCCVLNYFRANQLYFLYLSCNHIISRK